MVDRSTWVRWAGSVEHTSRALTVAVAVTVAVGLLDGSGWPSFVIGAVLALALWVMLFAGSYATAGTRGTVDPRAYAVAAATGTALGYLTVRIGDGNSAFWATGFIVAGAILPAALTSSRDRH